MPHIGFTGRCAGTKQLSCAANIPIGPTTKSKAKFEASSCMPEPDLIELFVRPLNDLGIRYLVSGSVAAMLYGEPRVTHDIDLVVFLRHNDIARLPTAFPPPEFYVPPPEVIGAETSRERGSFNIIHADSGLKADLYMAGRDEMDAWLFGGQRNIRLKELQSMLLHPNTSLSENSNSIAKAVPKNTSVIFARCSLSLAIRSTSQNLTNGFNAAVCRSNGARFRADLAGLT
jgi:hypothetical protein